MKAKDLLVYIRENLRDTNPEAQRINDALLLGFINQSQNYISSTFNLPVAIYQKELTHNDDLIHLPTLNLKIINALLDNAKLNILSPQAIQGTTPQTPTLVFIDFQIYQLIPFKSGELIIYYVPSLAIQTPEQEIALSDIFVDLLTYYVCKRAAQIETNANSLQRIQFYDSLIKGEKERLTQIIAQNNANATLQTPYKLV